MHPRKELQIHAKFLCAYIAPNLNHGELSQLDLEDKDISKVLEILGTTSSSSDMSACGFDMKFSALELLETLERLCISQNNLTTLAKADILPTLVSLLVNGRIPEQKGACRILYILLGESCFHFEKELYAPLLQEILISLFSKEDKCLQLLSQLLLGEPEIRENGNDRNCLHCNSVKSSAFPVA